MPFKFEKLRVWNRSLEYLDRMYDLAARLPRSEEYNLKSQLTRAATSVALNIAEGSTSQTNPEQARFLSLAIRSLVETVACQHIIRRRELVVDTDVLQQAYADAEELSASLHIFRKALLEEQKGVREEAEAYVAASETEL